MTTRVLTTSIWKFTIPAAALAGLTSLVFLQAVAPATAKPMSSCQVKHSMCSERCIMNNSDGGIGTCITRTCDHQHRGCGGDSVKGKETTGPKGGKGGRAGLVAAPAGDVRSPRGGAVAQKTTQAPGTSGPIMKPSSGANGKR